MEKTVQKKKKIIGNGIFLAVVFSLTVYLLFKGKDLEEIWEAVLGAAWQYLLVGLICMVLFIIGESVVIFYMMRTLGEKVRMGHCALYSFVGFFFSCITPSATGGQPMQIYYMKKDRLDIPVSTLVLMIVTITYKAVLVFIGLLVCLLGRDFLRGYMDGKIWVFYLGVGLNIFCVSFMLMLVFAPGFAKYLMVEGLKILEKLHIVKHNPGRMEKLSASMDKYHETAAFWAGHKRVIFYVFLITLIQRILLFTVTYWVYRSLGLYGYGIITVTILQSVISVSVDMLPLPGGMGISESLYLIIFLPVFGEGLLLPSLLLSRGISYYGQLLLSAIMTCVAQILIGRQKKGN